CDMSSLPSFFPQKFAEYLRPSERTDIVLVAVEALGDSGIFDKEVARNVLHVVMRHPDFWLADVPKIMSCIHRNLECIDMESVRQSVESLLVLLTNQSPTQVVISLVKFSPPGDSAGVAMWEVMLSVPQTLERILKEFLSKVQGMKLGSLSTSATEDACIPHSAPMASSDFQSEDFAELSRVESSPRHPSLLTVFLFFRGLVTLSERPDTARKMQVLLPHVMEVLQDGNTAVKMKALEVIRNVMGHLKRKEASSIAVQLVEKLLPLFDDESSQMRELSISFFRDMLETVVRSDKKRMKKKVRRGLLPLFFHKHDETDSVARASGEALLAAAELLKWKELKHLVQTEQTWRIGERLLLQDRSRAEEYCHQSLPYLKDAQASLREAAVRFIGLAARPLRDQSKEKLSELCSALQPMERDSNASVASLAAQTIIIILSSPRVQPRSGSTLRALCC
ncbi:Maestro heat-like repeat-containing protein family member 7, partial [Nipponia nippon]